ncbi:MAG: thioredoxin domain-containing protein, partial [Planctomycetes bacterium]|nr:thioredoxin domain-containing protein [Planctomycetota bacterium]
MTLRVVTLPLVAILATALWPAARGDDPPNLTATGHRIGGQPGALPYAASEVDALRAAVDALGASYAPRTRHRDESGHARFTNRLVLEDSPYLLQHAHNPVDWYPWGDAAFELAERLGRPVFLSVGYSTCHWCHVMEEESFEDLEIARFLNENFVAIKVDRERRPDVDAVYMEAVRLMTRNGGWPMTVILRADRRPVFGGTYFPPRDGPRGPGLLGILQQLVKVFREEPERVEERATIIADALRRQATSTAGRTVPGVDAVVSHVDRLRASFDPANAGFDSAPKFPQPCRLDLLLRYQRRAGDLRVQSMVARTLAAMANGGIHDHVGSGFHRYSTDAQWLVPHFEKMLYDNAQLAVTYTDAYRVEPHDGAKRIATSILEFVLRDLTSPEGGFYSATDADSIGPSGEREEGYYYTWTPEEVRAVLTGRELDAFLSHHPLTESGNFEGRNILHVTRSRTESARAIGEARPEFELLLDRAYTKLRARRAERPRPLLDDKIITGWNGLTITALARA